MGIDAFSGWQAFLGRVQRKHDQLMAEAVVGYLGLLSSNELDSTRLRNAWSSVRAEVAALVDTIGRTWVQSAQRAFQRAGVPAHEQAEQQAKGRRLGETLLASVERTGRELYADAARLRLSAVPDLARDYDRELHCRRRAFRAETVQTPVWVGRSPRPSSPEAQARC